MPVHAGVFLLESLALLDAQYLEASLYGVEFVEQSQLLHCEVVARVMHSHFRPVQVGVVGMVASAVVLGERV